MVFPKLKKMKKNVFLPNLGFIPKKSQKNFEYFFFTSKQVNSVSNFTMKIAIVSQVFSKNMH